MNILWLFAAGLAAGVISGMGIGGGVLLIPVLTFCLGYGQQSAQNLNLIYFLPTAAVALVTHVKNKSVETPVLPKIILFGAVGAAAGAMLAMSVDAELLRRLFGWFLMVMALVEFFRKE